MCSKPKPTQSDAQKRLETAYESERPRLLARLRKAGRTLEEAEDLIHDVYAERGLRRNRCCGGNG
jgi:DNA-directed RNA polymerase specialized sigma24 family protein